MVKLRRLVTSSRKLLPAVVVWGAVAGLGMTGGAGATALQACHPTFGASIEQNPERINQLEQQLGCRLRNIKWFQNWDEPFNLAYARSLKSYGKNLELSWQPRVLGRNGEMKGVPYRSIANGEQDAALRAMVSGLRQLNAPISIAFAAEMNGDWGVSQLGPDNTPADFVRAWRYIHNFFTKARVNVSMVWAPNILYPGIKTSYDELFPGDAYVSAVALSGYNWGNLRSYTAWKSFDETFGPSYRALTALTKRPIQIGEIGSAEQGGSKAAWIHGMCQALPKYTRLNKITWFELVAETDWRVTSSQESVSAMRQCLNQVNAIGHR